MTKTKQDKRARPAAVELHEASLDRAVGGLWNQALARNDTIKTTKDGTGNTVLTG